jgi:hypothetical protein
LKLSRTACPKLFWCITEELFSVVLVEALRSKISLDLFKCLNTHLKKVLKFKLIHYQWSKWEWVTITKLYFHVHRMAQSVCSQFKKETIKRKIRTCLKSNIVKLYWSSNLTETRYNQRSSICRLKLSRCAKTKLTRLRTFASRKRWGSRSCKTRLSRNELKMQMLWKH